MIQELYSVYQKRYTVHPANVVFQQADWRSRVAVVIPCFDEPNVLHTIQSLQNCDDPNERVTVIWVVNNGEQASDEIKARNAATVKEIEAASVNNPHWLYTHILHHNDLPKKHAGVGLARKIGMDYACQQMQSREEGILICYDADSQCKPNYLTEIIHEFDTHQYNAASIHYEHPLSGEEFSDETYHSILLYELHLRYYRQAQKFTGHPFAFHTVGSSMAVKASAYLKQGGMNKRKAGEDFYFLCKMMLLGNFGEISSTKVIPSPRSSHRVPFGTGKAVGEMLAQEKVMHQSYNFQLFTLLKEFFQQVNLTTKTVSVHPVLEAFLEQECFQEKLKEIQKQSTDETHFQKRFFSWFDLFLMMKFLHFARERGFPDNDVVEESGKLLSDLSVRIPSSEKELLEVYRELDTRG